MAYCYFNGEIIKEEKASITIQTIGVQRGFGIFDLFRVRAGKPTFMEDHLTRFDRSQRFLNLNRTIEKNEIRQAVFDLLKKNGFKESTFKLMLLGDGAETDPVLKPLFYIIHTDISNHKNPKSAGVILHEYVREYPEIKTINYLTSCHLHQKKMASSAIDVIYHDGKKISEASRSNVFMIKDEVLFTPRSYILHGITRKHILNLCSDLMDVKVADVTKEDLLSANEVFICSTLKEILPIVKVDGLNIKNSQIGTYTKKIQATFADYLHSQLYSFY